MRKYSLKYPMLLSQSHIFINNFLTKDFPIDHLEMKGRKIGNHKRCYKKILIIFLFTSFHLCFSLKSKI